MRCAPASALKRTRHAGRPVKNTPGEGTLIRQIYDFLQSHRGLPVEFQRSHYRPNIVVDLENYYGLDIRRISNGSSRKGRTSTYILAGEWFGKVYIDYVAERIAERLGQ